MFKIGEFSRFSRVSVKMLRHYDELGLLKPAHVDAFTNYRYYTADQLPRLHRILALRDLGFMLEQIGTMLDDELFLRFGANQAGYELPQAYIAHSAAEFVTEIQIPVEEEK